MNKVPHKEHWVIEINDINEEILKNVKEFEPYAYRYTTEFNLKIVKKVTKQFKPYGISLVYVLEESHIAFHSWPEYNYLHVDLFSCDELNLDKSYIEKVTKKIFNSVKTIIRQFD